MDASSFRTGDWLLVVGGAGMLVLAQLLDWATVESERGSGGLNNAFDYPLTGGVAWVLTVLAGLFAFLIASGLMRPGGVPWPVLLLGATGAATILMLIRVVLGAGEISTPGITFELQRGPGMWVGLVSAAVACAGAALNRRSAATGSAAQPPSTPLPQSG